MFGDDKITRRKFLSRSAIAASAFTIVPRHILGGKGHIAPSEKLNLAGIGIGGMSNGNVNSLASSENIVALCDVDYDFGAKVFNQHHKAKKYRDFRKMLDKEKNIDGVIVSTPDHTHFVITMTPIMQGKHVYCEKPLTQTIALAQIVGDAAAKAGVATQMGTRSQASEGMKRLQEMIADGAIGDVREVHLWTNHPTGKYGWAQGVDRPKEVHAIPASLNWDLWLGPAPARPYHPRIIHSSGADGGTSVPERWVTWDVIFSMWPFAL